MLRGARAVTGFSRPRSRWIWASATVLVGVACILVPAAAGPGAKGEAPAREAGRTGLSTRPLLTLPRLGRFSYRCGRDGRVSITLSSPPIGATELVTVRVSGDRPGPRVRIDPGERLTTPFGRRPQLWHLVSDHKPGRVTGRLAFHFEVDGVGGCVVTPVRVNARTASHAAGSGSEVREGWRRLPPGPDVRNQGYSALEAVRIGRRVVVVAGASYQGERVRGLVFDLRARRWSRLPRSPLRWRAGQTVVAAGRDAIVWGGSSSQRGARYDTGARRWTLLARSPLSRRSAHTAVWTGRRMLIWGGGAGRAALADGAAYDPRRDRWEEIAPAPIRGRALHTAVWTGRRMLVWGGDVSGRSTGELGRYAADGASYDPATNRWTAIAPSPVRSDGSATAVWNGRSMLVWTGAEGAEYDPAANRWRSIPPAPFGPRVGHSAVWSGDEMLVWGGNVCGTCFRSDGAAYDPRRRSWRPLLDSPLTGRDRHVAVAVPGGMFLWGGCCRGDRYLADGAIYGHGRSEPGAPPAGR